MTGKLVYIPRTLPPRELFPVECEESHPLLMEPDDDTPMSSRGGETYDDESSPEADDGPSQPTPVNVRRMPKV